MCLLTQSSLDKTEQSVLWKTRKAMPITQIEFNGTPVCTVCVHVGGRKIMRDAAAPLRLYGVWPTRNTLLSHILYQILSLWVKQFGRRSVVDPACGADRLFIVILTYILLYLYKLLFVCSAFELPVLIHLSWVESCKIWKFKKIVWSYRELITYMYRIDVWASHYKVNPPCL